MNAIDSIIVSSDPPNHLLGGGLLVGVIIRVVIIIIVIRIDLDLMAERKRVTRGMAECAAFL